MLLVNAQGLCVFTQVGVHVYISVCTLVRTRAHEDIKYKQHCMFSVYCVAPLRATQVINTSGISCVNITQWN